MALFRTDPAAGLRKAEAALVAAHTKIAGLEADRQTALAESDAVEPVHAIDAQIAKERAAAATHADRISVLKAAVRQQQAERLEQQRQAALAIVAKRLEQQVELARKVEQCVRDLGSAWGQLLKWRSAVLSGWPAGLALPPADAFQDIRIIQRELATALYAAGSPRWDKACSIPAPVSPIGVQGLAPKGLAAAVAAAGAGFIARIKAQKIDNQADEEVAA